MTPVQIRLMHESDLRSAERASDATFLEEERLTQRVNDPEPEPRTPEQTQLWIERMRFYQSVDPDGCWVAADERGDIIGFAISQNRGPLWYLATYGVLPEHQGQGIGKRLMDAVLAYADGRPGLFSSTVHPGATRRYRLAGFSLLPQMRMVGVVDRSTLPAIVGLSEGESRDLDWMNQLDADLRGAGHGPDHEYMLARMRLVVSRVATGPGYVYIDGRGRPSLLAAAHPRTAADLLWEALASAAQNRTLVNCITAANEWAVDVGLAARLDIGQEGYLALRAMSDPAPYLASGHFL